MNPKEFCHCGRRLHYTSEDNRRMVEKIIAMAGDYTKVTGPDGRSWKVQRHFVALHSLKGRELHKLGFEEWKE